MHKFIDKRGGEEEQRQNKTDTRAHKHTDRKKEKREEILPNWMVRTSAVALG